MRDLETYVTKHYGENQSRCDHDSLEVVSMCCGASNYYGFCGSCKEHTNWIKYCYVCDTELHVTVNEQRP